MSNSLQTDSIFLSVVIPVYFEEDCIQELVDRLVPVLEALQQAYEVVFVDDGSRDKTVSILTEICKRNTHLKLIVFSYNHGKSVALTAGFDACRGEYVVMMDPDLQDPPFEIPHFVHKLKEGFDIVYGVRKEKRDSFKNVIFSKLFWGFLNKMTGLNFPKGLAVMRGMNRKFVNQFLKYKEANRFLEGMFMHVGMNATTLQIAQNDRFAGVSKFNFSRKVNLALDAIQDFSDIPLRLAVKFGLWISITGALITLGLLFTKIFLVDFQLGWASLVSLMITGFGLQIFFIGVLSAYVSRIYKEVKRRPLFSVKEIINL